MEIRTGPGTISSFTVQEKGGVVIILKDSKEARNPKKPQKTLITAETEELHGRLVLATEWELKKVSLVPGISKRNNFMSTDGYQTMKSEAKSQFWANDPAITYNGSNNSHFINRDGPVKIEDALRHYNGR